MLAHQFILVLVGTVKRFESVLLGFVEHVRHAAQQMTLREKVATPELEDAETEQAA
jgi:hypothetical protein